LDIFIVAHNKNQVQNYIDKIEYEKIIGFILDDYDIIQDNNIRSPMIGLYSAFKELNKLNYKKLFSISCDMPLIQREVIKLIISNSINIDYCIPQWNNRYIEPLFAIYPIEQGLNRAEYYLKNEQFKLANLIDNNSKIRYISIEKEIAFYDKELLTFFNLNQIDDLQFIKKKIKKKELN